MAGEYVVSERNPSIRLCLSLVPIEGTSAQINRLTYLKLVQKDNAFPFEVVTLDAVSPLATIESGTSDTDMVVYVDVLPAHFLKPSPIKISGVAEVSSSSLQPFDDQTREVPWELSVGMEGQLMLEACRCDEENQCIQEPLVKKEADDVAPELRLCIVLNNSEEDLNLVSLMIVQNVTGVVMLLINEDEEGVGTAMTNYEEETLPDGMIVITVPQTSVFFLTPPPLPSISVEGSGKVGESDEQLSFTLLIPLVLLPEEMPSAVPTKSISPSVSSLPSHVHAPSYTPSAVISGTPSSLPSTSTRPSVKPEPGVMACVCDPSLIGKSKNVCEERLFSKEDNDLQVCLMTRPHDVELVRAGHVSQVQSIYHPVGITLPTLSIACLFTGESYFLSDCADI
jgi:hypothetical protein